MSGARAGEWLAATTAATARNVRKAERRTDDDPAVPVAVAVASPTFLPSAHVPAVSVPPLEGTDAAQPRSTIRAADRIRVDPAALDASLSDRDYAVLQAVSDHHFLTTRQLTTLFFSQGTTPASAGVLARRVLTRLRELRLLGTLERRIGGVRAGSTGLVYYLRERGHRVLHPDRPGRHRTDEPSATFLRHTLAIADTHLALVTAERAGHLEPVRVDLEPAAWRRFLTPAGIVQPLKPDLYAELAIPPDSDDLLTAFIEVDLGTEHLPTLQRKCRVYADYARYLGTGSGAATEDVRGASREDNSGMPLVVWSMTARTAEHAQRRREQLRALIARDPTLDAAMFRITEPNQVVTTLLHETGQKGDAL